MDEFYIPGFTNYLYSGEPAYGMADYTPQYIEPAYYPEAAYYPEVAYYPEQTAAPVAVEPDQPTPAPAPAPVEQTGMPVSVEPYVSPLEQVAQASAPLTSEQLADRRIAANTPPEGTFITAPLSNTGQATGFGDRGQTNAFQYWGGPIRVTDRNGNVLFSGEGPEAALEAVKFAQNLSDTRGANAAWDIQQGERTINPDGSVGEMRWISGPSDAKDGRGIIGDIGAFVIPAMVALATGGLSVPLQIGAAAAAGAAGNAFADRDPLAGAVTGGLTAAGGQLLGPAIGEAANLGAKTAGAIGSGLGATAGGLVTGQSLENALLGGLASGASSYFLPGVAEELGVTTPSAPSSSTNGGSGTFDGNTITVSGSAPVISAPVSINDGGGSSSTAGDTGQDTLNDIVVSGAPTMSMPVNIPSPPPMAQPEQPLDYAGIDVVAPEAPVSVPVLPPPALPQVAPPITNPLDTGLIDVIAPEQQPSMPMVAPPVTNPLDTGLIEVTAPRVTQPEPPAVAPIPLALPGLQTTPVSQPDLLGDVQPEAPPERNTLQDIIDYLRLAGLATSTLGGLVGGGGGGGGSQFRVPSGMGALNSVFSSKLPTPNLPGGIGGGGTGARTAADLAGQGLSSPIDYYRYGYGPEQSFFNYAPQGQPNTSQAYTGYARGGFAVEGAGDGRDDKIPALLSDGEYVIDAETVALLGNGSNKAGAQMLDQFRVNVRKQKGQKLARGEFSAKAKRPEHYLAGGRT